MAKCIVSNNGKFEVVSIDDFATPTNCILDVPNYKTTSNQFILNNDIKVSWINHKVYGQFYFCAFYNGCKIFSAESINKPQQVVGFINKYNSFDKEDLNKLVQQAQEKQKTDLELAIEALKEEKASLETQIKIYKEIQTKKEEIKELLSKLK